MKFSDIWYIEVRQLVGMYRNNFCHMLNCPYKTMYHLNKTNNEYICSGQHKSCRFITWVGCPKKQNSRFIEDLNFPEPIKIIAALVKHEKKGVKF